MPPPQVRGRAAPLFTQFDRSLLRRSGVVGLRQGPLLTLGLFPSQTFDIALSYLRAMGLPQSDDVPRDSEHMFDMLSSSCYARHTRESNRSSPNGRREPLAPARRPAQDAALADALLADLNPEQRAAAAHGDGPLLIVAGAGTGKTATLAHRVAHLIARGTDPGRILLLTFTRRASSEMVRRVDGILRSERRTRRSGALGRPGLGRHLPRRGRPPPAHPCPRSRPRARLHDPRPRRLRRPHAPRPHGARSGPQRLPLPAEVHVPRHLLEVRQRADCHYPMFSRRRSPGAARPRTTSSSCSRATRT